MMSKNRILLFVCACVLSVGGFSFTGTELASASEKVFKVGVVPQFEARRLHQIWRPILNQLEKKTGHKFELVGSPTIPSFEKAFLAGEFDFVYMNPYHMIMAHNEAGYTPLVRDVGRTLHGVLVVRKDGPIQNVEDLKKMKEPTFAFPAPNALAASLQMRKELTDDLHLQFDTKYVKTHDSVYLNVLLGEALAGGGVQETLSRQKEQIKAGLKVIYRTTPVNPHPFAVHPNVSLDVAQKVKQAMLQLGASDEGAALLKKIPIKKIGEASLTDYEPLKKMGLERFYKK
jgi:phosphonate transport system substrate-binding protein